MKKLFAILLALVFCAASAVAESYDELESVPDFSVTTIDGETFALSDLLAEKGAVLLNMFTTWCPPCQAEFPLLEDAFEEYGDRLGVVAVSVEPKDTDEALDAFRNQYGLSFHLANDADVGIQSFLDVPYFPITLLIGKDGKVLYAQAGSFVVYEQLKGTIEHVLSEDYDGRRFTFYGVYCFDQDGNDVQGVNVAFCTDTECTVLESGEYGMVFFYPDSGDYQLKVLQMPEGYELVEDFEPEAVEGSWALVPLVRSEE